MSYGPRTVFSDSIASGASTSAGVDLARGWKSVHAQIGTMSTSAQINVQCSADGGATFYSVYASPANTATVATNLFSIASSVGIGGGMVQLPPGLHHIRLMTTGVVSGGVGIKIVCSD